MATVSSVILQSAEWLMENLLTVIKQMRDGKYTEEYCESCVKPAVQAIREGREFQVVFPDEPTITSVADQLTAWEKLYQQEFGMECDFSSLSIPKPRNGFNWLIVVVPGLTIQHVFEQCQKHFLCWKYTDRDLNMAVPKNDRTPEDGPYAIWVQDRVEADQEHKNRSANQLQKKKVSGITLLERLLLELKYFLETGKHLDLHNWTLCSGSRHDDGPVPSVHWNDSQLKVHWCIPDSAYDSLRARQVVADA